ncbi:uracil glycosylase [Tieghemostelium lacteum]|uniref:Uracil glycosylase n=1 Tax=Tieghemostelium lacteum TaxID=361077 RepID=A0A151Z9I6_TIELA|nr:uracil glycosylase [Tieghemostelium lacteum]|eukprot:KYQ90608.1 uracil glycosylase [Tieghemostelium lacteum]
MSNLTSNNFLVTLKRLDSEGCIHINDNTVTAIGRLTEGLKLQDNNYISKSQIELIVQNKNIYLNNIGSVNPTYLKRSSEVNNDKNQLDVKDILGEHLLLNRYYPVQNNDIISFLGPEASTVSLKLEIQDTLSQPSSTDTINNSIPKTTTTTTTTTTTSNNNNNPSNKTTIKPAAKSGGFGGWSDLLLPYCQRPEDHKDDVVFYNDNVVMIRDKYPKSKYHFLTMPRRTYNKFSGLTKDDIPLLEEMYRDSKKYLESLGINEKRQQEEFKFGFHAIPSMKQLHLHSISKDFSGAGLKKKEHWISFTTDFFIPFNDFIDNLNKNSKITLDIKKYEALHHGSMSCPKCSATFSTLPSIKQHYPTCK